MFIRASANLLNLTLELDRKGKARRESLMFSVTEPREVGDSGRSFGLDVLRYVSPLRSLQALR
jgi:hypothetical protein